MADDLRNEKDLEELRKKQKGEKGGQGSDMEREQDVVDTGDMGGDYKEDEDMR